MPIYIYISIAIPVLTAYVLPQVLEHYEKGEKQYRGLLYSACGIFFASWYVPSPLIDGKDTAFMTHFIGGGVFSGLLWLYIKYSIKWRVAWYIEVASLFALVSALGNINELAELFMVKTNIAHITITDTSWDILANTLGALVMFIGYRLYDRWR